MDIGKFEADLRDLMGSPFHDRPFVCDGSPLDCQVFIVGINAASSMTEDFWDSGFWVMDSIRRHGTAHIKPPALNRAERELS